MSYQHESISLPNFLASSRYQNFTEQTAESVTAGSVFKKNGKTVGIVFNDVTVTDSNEPQPVAVMYTGWVVADQLPTPLADADKAALIAGGIHFRFDEDKAVPAAANPGK